MRIQLSILFLLALSLNLSLSAAMAGQGRMALPAPGKTGGVALSQALSDRRSDRSFADVEVTPQQLSDLLWSTAGVNRPDGKTTYPVAMGRKDMTVYVFLRQGVYRYDAAAHALEPVADGDHRADAGSQDFVARAAVNLAYVQDMRFWEESPEQLERGRDWGFAHTGAMMQNAYLYAAGQGWSAVVRGWFDQNRLKPLLKLTDKQFVRLVQSIGPKG